MARFSTIRQVRRARLAVELCQPRITAGFGFEGPPRVNGGISVRLRKSPPRCALGITQHKIAKGKIRNQFDESKIEEGHFLFAADQPFCAQTGAAREGKLVEVNVVGGQRLIGRSQFREGATAEFDGDIGSELAKNLVLCGLSDLRERPGFVWGLSRAKPLMCPPIAIRADDRQDERLAAILTSRKIGNSVSRMNSESSASLVGSTTASFASAMACLMSSSQNELTRIFTSCHTSSR